MAQASGSTAMLLSRPDLDAALTHCYDAALAPEEWEAAVSELAEAVGALGACFHPFNRNDRRLVAPMSPRYRDMLQEFLGGGWAAYDLRAQRGWPQFQSGCDVLTENELTTPEERSRLPIYAEFFRRHDLEMFGSASLAANGQLWSFNVVRSEKMGDFDAEAVSRLRIIRPYLTRLLNFSYAMSHNAALGALAALERSTTAAVLLDAFGYVVEVNAAASALLGDGLSVIGRRLRADQSEANATLEGLVAASTDVRQSRAGAGQASIIVPKTGGGALVVSAVPIRDRMSEVLGANGVIVLIADPAQRTQPSGSLLQRLYSLTPREAEVAVLIADERNVSEIAGLLSIQASSVRQIVKALMWKTGLQRQSQLVGLFSRVRVSL